MSTFGNSSSWANKDVKGCSSPRGIGVSCGLLTKKSLFSIAIGSESVVFCPEWEHEVMSAKKNKKVRFIRQIYSMCGVMSS